jgi:hypothetical protein
MDVDGDGAREWMGQAGDEMKLLHMPHPPLRMGQLGGATDLSEAGAGQITCMLCCPNSGAKP